MMQITSWTVVYPPPLDGYGKTIGQFNQIPPAGWARLFDGHWFTQGDDFEYTSHVPRINHDKLIVHVPYGSGNYLQDVENMVSQVNTEYYG